MTTATAFSRQNDAGSRADLATDRERQLTTARKPNNWFDQTQSGELSTRSSV